jgi:hypothetical protein
MKIGGSMREIISNEIEATAFSTGFAARYPN